MAYGVKLQQGKLSASTAQTRATLVAAVSGETIGLASIFVSAGTAMDVSIFSGSTPAATLLWKGHIAQDSGFQVKAPDGHFLCVGTAGEAITVSTSAVGDVFVSVLYGVSV